MPRVTTLGISNWNSLRLNCRSRGVLSESFPELVSCRPGSRLHATTRGRRVPMKDVAGSPGTAPDGKPGGR